MNGIARRATALAGLLRVVVFAPEEMLLIAGAPALRRATLDRIATSRFPAYGAALSTYTRALQQRNGLLRAIRDEQADRAELRYWDKPFLDAGGEVVDDRLRLLDDLAAPLATAHAEIAPDEAARAPLGLRYETNAPPAATESPGTPWPGGWRRRPRRRPGMGRHWSARIAMTSPSSTRGGTSPPSPRAASSGRRSWPSSSPSWTS